MSRNLHNYAKRPFPVFSGQIRDYPKWSREWRDHICKQYDETFLLTTVDECTPDEDDLYHYTTMEEVWTYLNNKYANSSIVATKLINEFVKHQPDTTESDEIQLLRLERRVRLLFMDLKAVGEQNQLIYTPYFIGEALKTVPRYYHNELMSLLDTNAKKQEPDRKSKYEVVDEYLRSKKESIERFAPEIGIQLIQTKSSNSNRDKGKQDKFCQRCQVAHPLGKHTVKLNAFGANDNKNRGPQQRNRSGGGVQSEAFKRRQREYGRCRLCNEFHTFDFKGSPFASSRFSDCAQWRTMTKDARANYLAQGKYCVLCLSWMHQKGDCKAKKNTCGGTKPDGSTCGGAHHADLCGVRHAYVNTISISPAVNTCHRGHHPSADSPVLLHLQEVEIRS